MLATGELSGDPGHTILSYTVCILSHPAASQLGACKRHSESQATVSLANRPAKAGRRNTSSHSLVKAIRYLSPVTDTSFATIPRKLRISCGRQIGTCARSICDLPAAWFRGRRHDSTTSKMRRHQLASETPFANNGVPFCLTMHHACTAPLL